MRLRAGDTVVTPPQLEVIAPQQGQPSTVRNGPFGAEIEATPDLLTLLEFFKQPRRVDAAQEQLGVSSDVLDHLHAHLLLFTEEERSLFRFGSVHQAKRPIGRSATLHEIEHEGLPARTQRVVVLGAGVDIGSSGEAGARHGPAAVRHVFPLQLAPLANGKPPPAWDFERHRQVDLSRLDVCDLGNVQHVVGESALEFGVRLEWFARRLHRRRCFVIGIGGDHSVTRFLLRPLIDPHSKPKPFGIVHFDAHTDLLQFGENVVTHANPFQEALASSALRQIFQIGPRELRSVQAKTSVDRRLKWVSSYDVWAQPSPAKLFAGLRKDLPYYLTFDVDCMASANSPETGTPEVGGLEYYRVMQLFEWLQSNVTLIGADFVEVAGPVSDRNQAALVTAHLLARLLLGSGRSARMKSQVLQTKVE